MEARYYQVKEKNNPKAKGIVLKISDFEIECLTGSQAEIEEYGCDLDKKGNLLVGEEYFFQSIGVTQAFKLKEDYENWLLQQGWIATDAHPISILANTIGTREHTF